MITGFCNHCEKEVPVRIYCRFRTAMIDPSHISPYALSPAILFKQAHMEAYCPECRRYIFIRNLEDINNRMAMRKLRRHEEAAEEKRI